MSHHMMKRGCLMAAILMSFLGETFAQDADGGSPDREASSGDAAVGDAAKLPTTGPVTPEPAEKPAVPNQTAPESAKSEGGNANETPLMLPGGIRIGGLFDATYERADRDGGLTSGRNAFRNFHHFLFLSRQGNDIPIGLNAEVIGLTFYELTARLWRKGSFRLSARAGKLLVPFGPEPVFHKSYGGLNAVDQKMFPVVWASFGVGLRAATSFKGFSLADDLYVVQGFDLPDRDRMLDMQRDLQAYDGARVAVGNRLSLSRGPLTLWYSAYWNPLRFGRRLLMQALDLAIWRPSLPWLNRLAAGVGVVRVHVSADSSFGGPDAVQDAGAYYHFADYLWLRGYVTSWLYLQARSGLATFNNHKGFAYDKDRADATDGSHHSLALVAEHAGAQVSLSYTWNFEKVDETANDFLRLMVMYAF
jgi:hypothetical protein